MVFKAEALAAVTRAKSAVLSVVRRATDASNAQQLTDKGLLFDAMALRASLTNLEGEAAQLDAISMGFTADDVYKSATQLHQRAWDIGERMKNIGGGGNPAVAPSVGDPPATSFWGGFGGGFGTIAALALVGAAAYYFVVLK